MHHNTIYAQVHVHAINKKYWYFVCMARGLIQSCSLKKEWYRVRYCRADWIQFEWQLWPNEWLMTVRSILGNINVKCQLTS